MVAPQWIISIISYSKIEISQVEICQTALWPVFIVDADLINISIVTGVCFVYKVAVGSGIDGYIVKRYCKLKSFKPA